MDIKAVTELDSFSKIKERVFELFENDSEIMSNEIYDFETGYNEDTGSYCATIYLNDSKEIAFYLINHIVNIIITKSSIHISIEEILSKYNKNYENQMEDYDYDDDIYGLDAPEEWINNNKTYYSNRLGMKKTRSILKYLSKDMEDY